MIKPIKKPLFSDVDIKAAIPEYILEGTPWHWDPKKEDHSDYDAFERNIDTVDWQSLSNWAIKKANEVKTPHKYFWWDEENEKIMHGPVDTKYFGRLPDDVRKNIRLAQDIPQDAFIIGFVFRNQLRKSVPNLLEVYKMWRGCYLFSR